MGLDGVFGDAEPHGDSLVHEPLTEQRQDLDLPRRQNVVAGIDRHGLRHRRRPGREPRCRRPNGGADFFRRCIAGQHGPRAGAQRPSRGCTIEIIQQHDQRRRIAGRLLLEAQGEAEVRLGSRIEHDDVGRVTSVSPGEEDQAWVLGDSAL